MFSVPGVGSVIHNKFPCASKVCDISDDSPRVAIIEVPSGAWKLTISPPELNPEANDPATSATKFPSPSLISELTASS